MARGRKTLSLDEQLEKITTEIENMENSLKEMKQTKTRTNVTHEMIFFIGLFPPSD